MELSLRHSVAIAPEVLCRELDGELVMLHVESGIYFGLDPVGTRMWRLIEQHASLQQVFDVLCDEFDAPAETIARDLLQLAQELCAKRLARVIAE